VGTFANFRYKLLMNKSEVIQAIIQELEAQLATATAASRQAAETATDEESKAETKWDTQGLEASYLAAGQAEQARMIGESIHTLNGFLSSMKSQSSTVMAGSLIECDPIGFFFHQLGAD
jgi:putative salt-induced outer membrane protein YdiY